MQMQMLCPNYANEMSWSVLPMWYANIVPRCAIDRLLTTDLDVNFSINANKMLCKSRFFIFDANAFHNDADARCPYDAHVSFQRCKFHDADVSCKGADAKFIHDGANAHI